MSIHNYHFGSTKGYRDNFDSIFRKGKEMKVIIAGSRDIVDYDELLSAIEITSFDIKEVVSGGARGADQLGERYALENSIPIKRFLPEWELAGKSAGIIRNRQMAEYADALIALWDGKSRGTEHMIRTMNELGKPVQVRMV